MFVCLRTHMYNCTRYALANKISVQYVYIHKANAILDNGVVRLDKWKDYLGIVIQEGVILLAVCGNTAVMTSDQ